MIFLALSLGFLFLLSLAFGRTFYALSALSLGGAWLAALVQSKSFDFSELVLFVVAFLELAVGFYAVLSIVYFVKRKREQRRKAREEICRRAVYMLPDRENTFLRERLQTGLRVEEEATEKALLKTAKEGLKDVRFEYARKLISRLKASPLSAADRLETENLSRLVALYTVSENPTIADLRSLNDCLSALLKLSAKYAVDCA